jgi:hypothetical protein
MRCLPLAVLALGACTGAAPGFVADAPPPLDAYTCDPAVTPGLPGPTSGDDELGSNHRMGQDCMACHTTGVEGAPLFTIAGTLYDTPTGNNPVSGATIVVTDSTGMEIRMDTAVNGNFYYQGAIAGFAASNPGNPIGPTWATSCPQKQSMKAAPLGSCNVAGCHDAAGVQGRVFLELPQ